jgi:hypothetical protein
VAVRSGKSEGVEELGKFRIGEVVVESVGIVEVVVGIVEVAVGIGKGWKGRVEEEPRMGTETVYETKEIGIVYKSV